MSKSKLTRWIPMIAIAAAGAAIPQARAGIVVTEVMSSSAHPSGTSNADWFELTNNGASAFDLTGFSWDDDSATAGVAHFGGITSIAAGQSIVVTGETLGAEASFKSDWNIGAGIPVVNLGSGEFQSFSSSTDQIHIFNASNVEVLSLTFGAATTGFSLEWDTNGNSLASSVIGQNGAYQASSDGAGHAGIDVGSPGTAVPEPASLALLATALPVLGRRRRRA